MLIEFRVRNFRSFRDESAFSLVATPAKEFAKTHVAQAPFRGIPGLLRSAAIYGANASGKSNLIRAMHLMRGIVRDSAALQPNQKLNVQPFALDAATRDRPVEMEITFLKDEVRYQYGFTATTDRINSEWLLVYRTNKPQTWFRREYRVDRQHDQYVFGSGLQGQRNIWQQSTRPNALFLSTAVQLNSDQLKPVFDWIAALLTFENGSVPVFSHTVDHILNNPEHRVEDLLRSADIAIAGIRIDTRTAQGHSVTLDLATGRVQQQTNTPQELKIPLFQHEAPGGEAVFELRDESEGTQRLFALAGPLFEIFREGRVICVDELDRSLHTLLVRQIVQMFHDPQINTGGAQLVFTTHDTSLLSANILRRDQIWFTEKTVDQASRLYPLSDFSVRKSEALERGYLTGRYGAIPVLSPMADGKSGTE